MPLTDPSRWSKEERERFAKAMRDEAASIAANIRAGITMGGAEKKVRQHRFIRALFPPAWRIEYNYDLHRGHGAIVVTPSPR